MAYGHRRYSGTRHERKTNERVLSRREDGEEIITQLFDDLNGIQDSVHWDEWDETYGLIWCGDEACACPCSRWRLLVCTACGRHLDYDFPWFG